MRLFALLLRRLLAAGGLTALLAGVPAALIWACGLPDVGAVREVRWHTVLNALGAPLSDSAIVTVIVVAVWLVWARFALAVLAELPAALSGLRAPRIRLLGPEQALAGFLFTAIGLVPAAAASAAPVAHVVPVATASPTSTATTAGSAIVAVQAMATPAHTTTAAKAQAPITATGVAQAAVPRYAAAGYDGTLTVRVADTEHTVRVARNDTLWDIAERHLDDPHRWPEIYELNRDRYDDDGHMRGGQHIEAGWHLRLPDDASATPAHPKDPRANRAERSAPAPPPAAPESSPPSPSVAPTPPSPRPPDGVVEPPIPPAGAGPPSSPPPAAGSPSSASPSPSVETIPTNTDRGDRAGCTPAGVTLPAGGWIDIGLALAILAAVALTWAHRRRRYTHQPSSPRLRLHERDTAAMPATVTHVRRALRRDAAASAAKLQVPDPGTHHGATTTGTAAAAAAAPPQDAAAGHLPPAPDEGDDFDDEDDDFDEDDDDYFGDDDDEDDDDTRSPYDVLGAGTGGAAVPGPVRPGSAHPVAELWAPAGLGLTGPGADAAARGFLTAALSTDIDDPHARARVVMASATCATLLGAAAVSLPSSPRLTITAGLPEALSRVEEHILHRTRVVYDAEVDSVAGLRDADPYGEALPAIVLIADASAHHERARVAALLTQGQRLDIHGILLGAWPDGDTVHVVTDGSTHPVGDEPRHGAHPADVGRLSVLSAEQCAELLGVLIEADTGEPPPPAPTEAPTVTPAAFTPAPNDKKDPSSSSPASDDTTATEPLDPDDDEASPTDAEKSGGRPGRVSVRLFGRPTMLDRPERPVFRSKAVELMAYLAVQDGPVHRDIVLEDVLGDLQRDQAPKHLNLHATTLRQVCKATGGSNHYVHRIRDRFHLEPTAFDLDVWQLRDNIAKARGAVDPATRIAALRAAVAAYTAEFAQGCDYDWAEPYRQALAQQAMDASIDLAQDLSAAGDLDDARDVLAHAIGLHPDAERLYQDAMRVHAARGDVDGIRALRAALTRHLSGMETDPTDETLALADRLVAEARKHPKNPPRRPPT